MSELVYIDSNVFIFPVIYGDADGSGKGVEATRILRKVESGQLSAYTSVLTWDEVVWVIRKKLGIADSIESGKKMLRFPNLRFIEIGEAVISRSQSLIQKYSLKPRDAIHCSSAISKGIDLILSDDPDFDSVKEIKRSSIEEFTLK